MNSSMKTKCTIFSGGKRGKGGGFYQLPMVHTSSPPYKALSFHQSHEQGYSV